MWFKNFRHKKVQTFMMFMIILLCSMQLTASVSILISLDKPFDDFAKECESPSAVLYPYSTDKEEVRTLGEQFRELDQVKNVEYTLSYGIKEEITYQGNKIEAFTNLTEYNSEVYGKVRYLEGKTEETNNLKVDECIIPACLRNEYHITTGEKIKILLAGEEYHFTVKGVYTDPYNTSTAFNSSILIKSLPESIVPAINIVIYGKEEFTGDKIEASYREKYDGQLNAYVWTLEERIDSGILVGNIAGAIFLAIGIIMLFVSILIINFMIRNTMITDAKTIAIYKSMGYSSRDILKLYLTYYFVVVSTACVIGISSSVFLSDMILGSVFENMGEVVSNSVLIPGILCYLLIVGFVLIIIYKIINQTKKVKPIYALNGMTNSSTQKKKIYKGNLRIQFSALGIALRTLSRNKKSAVSIIITAIVTIFSVNFGIISLDVAYTMKDNNDYWMGVDKCEVMIGVSNPDQYEAVKRVIENDERINYYLSSNLDSIVIMKWEKGMPTTDMKGFVYDDFGLADIPIIKGKNPEAGNEIAISSKIAREKKKDIGDYLVVYLEGEKQLDLLITGIFQTYNELGDACRMTTAVYTDHNYEAKYNNFSIYLKDHEDIESFINDMKERVGGNGNVIPRTEAYSSIMNYIVAPQKKAILPVCLVVLLIGGINIFCIVLLKNASNERINSIYKSIGYSTGHLILSNLYYVAMIALVSVFIALPLTLIFYPGIMRTCLGMFGFIEYPVDYNAVHIAWANIMVFIIFIISTLLSSRSLRKVSVRNLVQE